VRTGDPVTLTAEGLELRVWTHDDAPVLLATAADPVTMQWNPLGLSSADDARRWIDNARSWRAYAIWAVCDAVTGEVVGKVALDNLDAENASAEVGYWVVPSARGHGVAGRALRAAADFAFGSLGLERVELFHAVENTASCRVAEKAGFALEGTARRSYRYGDGVLHDEHLHARLRDDA